MRITGNPIMLGVPFLAVSALVAVLALWAWGPLGATSGGGATTSTANMVWNVEYWHHNADGDVLQHRTAHNTVTGVGVEAAMERVINASLDLGSQTDGAGLLTEANTWDQIALMNAANDVTDGVAAIEILDEVDGGSAQNADRAAGGAQFNPADGAYTDSGTTTDGKGDVTLQFLAEAGNPAAALRMVLGKFAARDNVDDAGAALAAADILAFIDINVDLAATDTLTITWTLDIDP